MQSTTRPVSARRRVGLLGDPHSDDVGKKCLVLDLDETLVHSSFQVSQLVWCGQRVTLTVKRGTILVVCFTTYIRTACRGS